VSDAQHALRKARHDPFPTQKHIATLAHRFTTKRRLLQRLSFPRKIVASLCVVNVNTRIKLAAFTPIILMGKLPSGWSENAV